MSRIKFEFQSYLYRCRGDMLDAIAETWLSADGADSLDTQRQTLVEQTDVQLAAECIEGWELDDGADALPEDPDDDDERSHMAFNGYDADSLAAAFADRRATLTEKAGETSLWPVGNANGD